MSGHFVEDLVTDLGFCLLVWKTARSMFRADDHLPAAHLRFCATALIVYVAYLRGPPPAGAYCAKCAGREGFDYSQLRR